MNIDKILKCAELFRVQSGFFGPSNEEKMEQAGEEYRQEMYNDMWAGRDATGMVFDWTGSIENKAQEMGLDESQTNDIINKLYKDVFSILVQDRDTEKYSKDVVNKINALNEKFKANPQQFTQSIINHYKLA